MGIERSRHPERPRELTALALFCTLTVVFLVPRDVFFAETRDVEVWLGFEVRGPAAWFTAPLHWAIFAVGAWAAWRCRPWVLPVAAGYVFYVALSHLIWSEASANGEGWRIGILLAAAISVPGFWLLSVHRSARQRSSTPEVRAP